ncbi:MAG: hypothetical protein U0136_07445 [Bdellovibrionota bacterium]
MKAITFISFFLFLIHATLSQAQDFQSARWDMSSQDVIRLEQSAPVIEPPVIEGTKRLSFRGAAFGIPSEVTYQFVNNQLVAGAIKITALSEVDSRDQAQLELKRIKDTLTAKYGHPEPIAEPKKTGEALQWKNTRTRVMLLYGVETGRLIASVFYYSRKYHDIQHGFTTD